MALRIEDRCQLLKYRNKGFSKESPKQQNSKLGSDLACSWTVVKVQQDTVHAPG